MGTRQFDELYLGRASGRDNQEFSTGVDVLGGGGAVWRVRAVFNWTHYMN